MIFVWGSRGRNKTLGQGQFHCPDCAGKTDYDQVQVNKWFTMYWIPVFPMGELGQYVECKSCKGTFNNRVLEFDPEAIHERFEAAFSIAAKRVMFKMALADGEIDESEIDTITQAFENITKREIKREDIAAELEAAREDTRTVKDYLSGVAPSLNDTGKEQVLRSAIAVAKADGVVDDDEIKELSELALALDMPAAYSKGVFLEEGIKIA